MALFSWFVVRNKEGGEDTRKQLKRISDEILAQAAAIEDAVRKKSEESEASQ